MARKSKDESSTSDLGTVIPEVVGTESEVVLAEAAQADNAVMAVLESLTTRLDAMTADEAKQEATLQTLQTNLGKLDAYCMRLAEENANLKTGRPMELTPEIIEALKAALPPDAISPHPENSKLSSIKAIYVIERLNDVFGIAGWSYEAELLENSVASPMIVVKVTLSIPKYGVIKWAFGGNANSDRGDAYKGAVTDAITKIGSMLYIGMDVFKGHGPSTGGGKGGRPTVNRAAADALTTTAASATAKAETKTDTASVEAKIKCDDCGHDVIPVTVDGTCYAPAQIVLNSQNNWKKDLCGGCQRARRNAERAANVTPQAAPAVATAAAGTNGAAGPIR